MITNTLQKRISAGDREAFKAVYSEYGRGVFLAAMKALGSEADARVVVKQTFLNLHRDLLNAADDVDIPVRIRELTEHELLLTKILRNKGVFDAAAQGESLGGYTSAYRPGGASARSVYDAEDLPEESEPLPPLERTYAYMEADRVFASKRSEEAPIPAKAKKRGGFQSVLVVLLLLVLLWALAGVLMDIRVIPAFDLGYRWFNQTIFPLFSTFGS
jgi:DNA-directed RNA polymerase specialized sigma24 family protein